MVQLSHPYMTTGTTIALTRQTFVAKITSLLFNMLSRLVIAFLRKESDTTAHKHHLHRTLNKGGNDYYSHLFNSVHIDVLHLYQYYAKKVIRQ